MKRFAYIAVAMLLVFAAQSQAESRRSRRMASNSVPQNTMVQNAIVQNTMIVSPEQSVSQTSGTVAAASSSGCAEALDEVNATRAQRGLKPFIHDPELSKAAYAAAQVRAASRNAGHTSNDFSYVPSGSSATSAGCAAWEPSWGWGSCCTYDNYTYAGAAWVMGSDGRRYMHLYVR